MKRYLQRIMAAGLAVVTAFSLAACGGSDNEEDTGESGSRGETEVPEWVWVPEYMELDGNGSYWSMQIMGDYLYYESYNWDEETRTSSLNKYSMLDGSVESVPLEIGDGSLNSFQVGEDGSVYAMIYFWSMDETTGEYSSWQSLVKYDASGNEVYNVDLAEIQQQESIDYFGSIVLDDQDRVYMVCDSQIVLFDAEGNFSGTVSIGNGVDSWINYAGKGKDGKIYACAYVNTGSSGGYKLYEIDFDKKATGATYDNFPSGNGSSLNIGVEKDFLVHDGSTVYEYDMATQTSEALFQWIDSDINGQYVNAVSAAADGKILAVINDWNTGEYSIALLTKTPGSEVPQKETIVLGTLSTSSELQAAAVNFNKTNDKYRISIKQYLDTTNWTENTWSDALANFTNDIATGDCPDLIDISNLNVEQMASKGVFEDITPYLESSTALNREDYLENVLEGYTFGDVLIGIPKSFYVQTVVGSANDLGEEMGWSLQDLIAYADEHPDARLFDYTSKSNIMYYCMAYNENEFVDWTTGECNFNSPEFISLLEFVNRFPEEPDYDSEISTPSRIQSGEVLLDNVFVSSFEDLQVYDEIYSGKAVYIGYPTIDGSIGCSMTASEIFAIAARSSMKEGAWAFIESYLVDADSDRWSWGFPTNKAQLQAKAEEAVKVETYTWVDEDGVEHEEVASGGGSVMYQDGWTYEYHTTTQEEADQVLALIEVAKPASSQSSEIMTIISEEAEAFYKGQKSAEEVADVIQRRAQIYVSENS